MGKFKLYVIFLYAKVYINRVMSPLSQEAMNWAKAREMLEEELLVVRHTYSFFLSCNWIVIYTPIVFVLLIEPINSIKYEGEQINIDQSTTHKLQTINITIQVAKIIRNTYGCILT